MIQPTKTNMKDKRNHKLIMKKRIQERENDQQKIEKRRKLKHNTRIKRIPKFYELFNYHYLVFVLFVVG